ncbi:MAG: hypothetical protein COA97_06525 [Flavobacteriales bacterium]|nr:MAG: hypothetical protein COA97_06525 [Flavobacteriales bacterium]
MRKFLINILLLFNLMASIELKAQEKISVAPVSFNTEQREYGPVLYKGGLVFSGVSQRNKMITYQDENSGKQLTDLFYAQIAGSTFGKIELFSEELKSKFHDGPITFSKDGSVAYFTRTLSVKKSRKNSLKNGIKLGIFKAKFNGDKWTDITPCNFNSTNFNIGQPTLSEDGKRLFVTSDKPGGNGGMDLYYAEIIEGKCGELVNLGSTINTKYDEMFPIVDGNNKLYFSSNRTDGLGGLDLYTSWFSNNLWNTPYSMEPPVNSPSDDFGIIFNENETGGYFCSDRAGSDDIYKFTVIYPPFEDCQKLKNELLCYQFFEKASINVDGISMVYEWDFGDGNKKQSLEAYHCYKKTGNYTVKLNVLDPSIGKTFVNKATYNLEIESIVQPKISFIDTISILEKFNPQIDQGKWKEFEIDNYYVDYGYSIVKKNPKQGSHFQSMGLKKVKFLITGYDKKTQEIKSKCFYKNVFVTTKKMANKIQTKIAADNKFSDPSSDRLPDYKDGFYALEIISVSESALANKTVLKEYFKKVKEIYDEKSGNYSYVFGKAENPYDLIEEFRAAQKAGFTSSIVKAFESTNIKIEDLGIAYEVTSGEVNIILHNIKFDYKGYLLNENSKIELKKLIQYLKDHPEINIEIGAHTDSKGNNAYNIELSQKRANSVIIYLNKEGIKVNRLTAKGYGESNPIEPNQLLNGDDNPDGRAKNRRVVFKILNQ